MPLLTILLLLISTAAYAGDNDFRCPAPGTKIETSGGAHLIAAEGSTGFDCQMMNGTEAFTMHAAFANLKDSAESRDAAEKLWPLQIGKELEYTTVCDNLRCIKGTRFHNKIRVAGFEPVRTAAGTFRAYKVTRDVRSFEEDDKTTGRGESFHAQMNLWWSPEIGYLVRYEWRFLGGFAYSSDHYWEAKSIVSGTATGKISGSITAKVSGTVAAK